MPKCAIVVTRPISRGCIRKMEIHNEGIWQVIVVLAFIILVLAVITIIYAYKYDAAMVELAKIETKCLLWKAGV